MLGTTVWQYTHHGRSRFGDTRTSLGFCVRLGDTPHHGLGLHIGAPRLRGHSDEEEVTVMLLHPDLRRIGVQPQGWLGQKAAGLLLTFDVDAESNLLSRGEHYLEHLSTLSHQQYGPRIGVPRLLALLAEHNAPATFFVPGVIAERWPETVDAILQAGHEVGLHGYLHRSPADLPQEDQREELERGLAALQRLGAHPAGYRAPSWELTMETLRLLAEHGVLYDSSLMDDDRPYVLKTPWGPLAELPPHWSLDDWEQYAYLEDPPLGQHIESPSKVAGMWTAELEAMRRTASLLTLTCHPLLSGRPSRVRAIERLIEYAEQCDDVALWRGEDLARAVLAAPPDFYACP
jgi:peptidoglycan/xylan/chitin deacetylase (PgdA/CDA1 family)